MVLPDSHGVSRVPWYSGTRYVLQSTFAYGAFTLYGYIPSVFRHFRYLYRSLIKALQPQMFENTWFGLIPFRSPLLWESRLIYFLFLRVLRCFTSPGSPLKTYVFSQKITEGYSAGFPHSEIIGSMPTWQLSNAYRSLSRLSSPP